MTPTPNSRPTDEDLVAAARNGDRRAMDQLLRRHHDRIWAVCRRLAGNDADAADATQEALLRIVRRIDTFDGRSRFTTWAHRVATNACLDELRRRQRRPRPGLGSDRHQQADEQWDPPSTEAAVDDTVTDRVVLDRAVAELPEEFRLPLVLRDVAGHDYAEIGSILGIPPGTVRSRIARGRRRLATALGPEGGNRSPADERPSIEP